MISRLFYRFYGVVRKFHFVRSLRTCLQKAVKSYSLNDKKKPSPGQNPSYASGFRNVCLTKISKQNGPLKLLCPKVLFIFVSILVCLYMLNICQYLCVIIIILSDFFMFVYYIIAGNECRLYKPSHNALLRTPIVGFQPNVLYDASILQQEAIKRKLGKSTCRL